MGLLLNINLIWHGLCDLSLRYSLYVVEMNENKMKFCNNEGDIFRRLNKLKKIETTNKLLTIK
jgi:hypothetical protein